MKIYSVKIQILKIIQWLLKIFNKKSSAEVNEIHKQLKKTNELLKEIKVELLEADLPAKFDMSEKVLVEMEDAEVLFSKIENNLNISEQDLSDDTGDELLEEKLLARIRQNLDIRADGSFK